MQEFTKPVPYRISFRQKGAQIRGNLIRGTISNAYQKSTLGTIPAKFESILKPISFKNQSYYNFDKSENSLIKPPLNLNLNLNSKSMVSQESKALGQLDSKSNRNNNNISEVYYSNIYSSSPNMRVNVAINDEELKKALESDQELKHYDNILKNFNDSLPQMRFKYKSNQVPGPGSYNPRKDNQKSRKVSSCFRSCSFRYIFPKVDITPSPAHYNTDLDSEKRLNVGQNASYFKNSISNIDDNSIQNVTDRYPKQRSRFPGPGYYSEHHNTILQNFQDNYKLNSESRVFLEASLIDKFGNPKYELKSSSTNPGPGSYEINNQYKKDENSHSPEFKNGAKRYNPLKINEIKPGPAYYNIKRKVSKESLNNNPNTLWY